MSSFSARLCPSSLPSSWSPTTPGETSCWGGFGSYHLVHNREDRSQVRKPLSQQTARQHRLQLNCAVLQSTGHLRNGAAKGNKCRLLHCKLPGRVHALDNGYINNHDVQPCSGRGTPESWRSSLAARRAASRGGGLYPPPLGGFAPDAGAGCWGAPSTAGATGLVSDCGDRVPPLGALLAAAARTLAPLVCLFGRVHSTPKLRGS